jgi:hypothetical protein
MSSIDDGVVDGSGGKDDSGADAVGGGGSILSLLYFYSQSHPLAIMQSRVRKRAISFYNSQRMIRFLPFLHKNTSTRKWYQQEFANFLKGCPHIHIHMITTNGGWTTNEPVAACFPFRVLDRLDRRPGEEMLHPPTKESNWMNEKKEGRTCEGSFQTPYSGQAAVAHPAATPKTVLSAAADAEEEVAVGFELALRERERA